MMDFTQQFKRLYPLFIAECKVGLPSINKILSYVCQLLFCGAAIIAITTWDLLSRMGDEIEKMQKKTEVKKPERIKKQERYECAFVKGVTCTSSCESWVKVRGGGGYCRKMGGW